MNKTIVAKTLSLLITASGLAVMAGWLFDVAALKSLGSAWISMKFPTAFSFVVSGASLFFLARAREGEPDTAQVALFISSFILMLLMGLIFFSAVLNIRTGIEDLFVKDPGGANCVLPGRPSAPTMINFLLIALAGILTLVNAGGIRFKLKAIGVIIGFTGALALIGYAVDAPLLYYYIEGKNSAMALHTAGLFILWGAGLLCL
jgi:hypothetical protein